MPSKPGSAYTYTGKTSRETLGDRSRTHGAKSAGASEAIKRTNRIWRAMKNRCLNPKYHEYRYYGGRGITVCERWMTFENFLEDMGECPDSLTIDRKDTNLGYYKDNCEWATQQAQQNNRRNNYRITVGDETKTAMQWSRETGLLESTIRWRHKHGLDPFSADRINNAFLTIGDQTKSLSQWARETGLGKDTIRYRYDKGLPPELILSKTRLRGANAKPCGPYGKRA